MRSGFVTRSIQLLLCLLLSALPARAQNPTSSESVRVDKLAFVLPSIVQRLIGNIDPTLQPIVTRALTPTITAPFASLNAAVVTQLSNLPVSSPASGTRYQFDRQLGVYVPFAQSLGPILAERAETIGAGRFLFAITHQQFAFDRADDLDLRSIDASVPFEISGLPGLPPGLTGIGGAHTYVGLHLNETTAYFTYGVAHWLDVSLATPVVSSSMTVRGTGSVAIPALGVRTDVPAQSVHASATGLGDQLFRVKARLPSETIRVAAAGDVRLPTGDEFNFHGAGAYGVKVFGIASTELGTVSPHVNVGYERNGSTLLADPAGVNPMRLPTRAFVIAGMDAAVTPRFTVAVDVSDHVAFDRPRTVLPRVNANGIPETPLGFERASLHETNLAAGFKTRLIGQMVASGNVQLRLNEAGLRVRVVPNVGVSWLF